MLSQKKSISDAAAFCESSIIDGNTWRSQDSIASGNYHAFFDADGTAISSRDNFMRSIKGRESTIILS